MLSLALETGPWREILISYLGGGDSGQKEPCKSQCPGCFPLPSSTLSPGSKGRGLRDHHSDSGLQTLSSFRVQREDSGGAQPMGTAVN